MEMAFGGLNCRLRIAELGMDKKGEIQSFLRGVSIQRVFGWMDTQDLVWMDGLSIELIM